MDSPLPLVPSDPHPKYIRAIWDFIPRNADDLPLGEWDIVTVEYATEGWYYGEHHGQKGWFPINYTEPISEQMAIVGFDPDPEPDDSEAKKSVDEEIPSLPIEGNKKWYNTWKSRKSGGSYTSAAGVKVRIPPSVDTKSPAIHELSNETTSPSRSTPDSASLSTNVVAPTARRLSGLSVAEGESSAVTVKSPVRDRPASGFVNGYATVRQSWLNTVGGADEVARMGLSKMEVKRQEVIWELITTEADYVRDLDFTIETYIKPLRAKKLMQTKDLDSVFSNLEQLLPVNQELLRKLEERKEQKAVIDEVGDIFLRLSDYFKMYNMYCSNHSFALIHLQKIERDKAIHKFLESCAALPECRSQNLYSYLIKPVQRICKYPLLLREIIKNTDPGHKDARNATDALAKIETVVAIVNEAARQTEAVHKMLRLQSRFVPKINSIVTPTRRLVRSLNVQFEDEASSSSTEAKPKPRLLLIFNDMILFAKSLEPQTENGRLKVKNLIPYEEAPGIVVLRARSGGGEKSSGPAEHALEIAYSGKTCRVLLESGEVRDDVAKELMDLVRVVQATGKKRTAGAPRPRPLSISKMPSSEEAQSSSTTRSDSNPSRSSPLSKESGGGGSTDTSQEKSRSSPRKALPGTPPAPPLESGAASPVPVPASRSQTPVPPARTGTPVSNAPPKILVKPELGISSAAKVGPVATEGNTMGPPPQPGQESTASRTAKGSPHVANISVAIKPDPCQSLRVSDDSQGGRARGPSVSKVNKPTKSARIVDVLKAGKNSYVYVLEVERVGDSTSAKIYNTFEDFFDLHLQLLGHFPVEAGAALASGMVRSPTSDKRIIPDLPSQMMFVTYEVARTRGVALQTYIDVILTLPAKISRSPVVNAFFNPRNSIGKHATPFASAIGQVAVGRDAEVAEEA